MVNLNRAMIIGNLTRDPEVRTTPSGQSVASLGVATSRTWTNQAGVKQEETEFHSVVAWGRLAEICQQYMHKGMRVYVEGRIKTRSWDDQTGAKKFRTEIIAEGLIMLDRAPAGGGVQSRPEVPGAAPTHDLPPDEGEIKVEEIPF
jgi:single-strand DNA-binding protein